MKNSLADACSLYTSPYTKLMLPLCIIVYHTNYAKEQRPDESRAARIIIMYTLQWLVYARLYLSEHLKTD